MLSLEALSTDIARAACTDGTIYGTMTGGRKWTRLGALKGIRAIAYASLSEAMALVARDGCAAQVSGVVLTTDDKGKTWANPA